MNKLEITEGLYRQNVYNVRSPEGYGHFTCYFNSDFSFFVTACAGHNIGMVAFIENDTPSIVKVPQEVKDTLIRVLSEWTYSHIEPILLTASDSLRDIFKNPLDAVIAKIYQSNLSLL